MNKKTSLFKKITDWLIYKPQEPKDIFVLVENDASKEKARIEHEVLKEKMTKLEDLVIGAKELKVLLEECQKLLKRKELNKEDLEEIKIKMQLVEVRIKSELTPIISAYEHGKISSKERSISISLEENKKILGEIYHLPQNKDLMMRDFELEGTVKTKLMLVFMDGMIDKQLVSTAILQPLMMFNNNDHGLVAKDLVNKLMHSFIPHVAMKTITTYKDAVSSINGGNAVLFVEGTSTVIDLDVKGYKTRGIEKPQIEPTTRGSQASFSESLRINTSLLRSMFQNTELVSEIIPVGTISPKNCAIIYMADTVNPTAVKEIKNRIKKIKMDYVFNTGSLSKMLSDDFYFPQFLSTERPDRTISCLVEGRIAIMMEGDPFAYILPVSVWDYFQNPEDYELRSPAALFMRIIRYVGMFITIYIPALYIALNYYHHSAIPTELVLAIAASRQLVPFPSIVEIILMIFAFELIREATLRVPGPLGGSIGIVGAIILGQAAVTAQIVSPLLVVVVAFTGLSSYALPEYRMSFALRVLQYPMLLGASLMGLVGIAIVNLILLILLVSTKSLGMPFLTPITPVTATRNDIMEAPSKVEGERLPDALNTLRARHEAGPPVNEGKNQEKGNGDEKR